MNIEEKYLMTEETKTYNGYAIFAKYGKEGKLIRQANKSDLKKDVLLRGRQGVDGGYLVKVTGKNIKKTPTGDYDFEFVKIDNGKTESSILSNFGIPNKIK